MPGDTAVYAVPATAHYSWPKAGALLGLGESQMERVPVDEYGRLNTDELRKWLVGCATARVPVLFVVAIIGSTAEGAIDPICKVEAIRNELRKDYGLDFNIHADAAWGGYCCALLSDGAPTTSNVILEPATREAADSFVPITHLSSYVEAQLRGIHYADTVTIDPHKAGYIQYPAGAIVFQNKQLRDLLAYKAPYISPTADVDDPSVGTYGIDGSRAGAAAAATYLHHRVTGLNPDGHGLLIGQANFTTKILWAVLSTMAKTNDPFRISQIHQPSDKQLEILKRALTLPNEELVYDEEVVEILKEYGPDFLINVFAVNYAYPVIVHEGQERKWNTSAKKSMELMGSIGEQLNIPYTQLDPDTTRPKGVSRKGLFIIRTNVYKATYVSAY
jgi:Pyridoxal-dependent decarboxylase conserved domain